LRILRFFFFFFFFQAEDGIRDFHVTGVQTCALPISSAVLARRLRWLTCAPASKPMCQCLPKGWFRPASRPLTLRLSPGVPSCARSEERRVGKECRSRWWAGH